MSDQDVQGHDGRKAVGAHGSLAHQEAVKFLKVDLGSCLDLDFEHARRAASDDALRDLVLWQDNLWC